MIGKVLAVLTLLLIVGSLFTALHRLTKREGSNNEVVKALTVRIGLSVCLFLVLLASYRFGLIPEGGLR